MYFNFFELRVTCLKYKVVILFNVVKLPCTLGVHALRHTFMCSMFRKHSTVYNVVAVEDCDVVSI